MKTIDTKSITPMEKVETIEAENLYNKNKHKYCAFYIIPFFISFELLTLLAANAFNQSINIILILFSTLATIIGYLLYKKCMKPYKELLDIAKHNDLIRHDQKIRFREQKRLMEENKNKYTTQQIHETAETYKDLDDKKN